MKSIFFFLIGLVFLGFSKAKYKIRRVPTPKSFDCKDSDRCIDYDIKVVQQWLSYLKKYTGKDKLISGKTALELGPGSDLGVGIYLLFLGCDKYIAFDVNNLEKRTPYSFYEKLFNKLEKEKSDIDITCIKKQFQKYRENKKSKIKYIVRKDFDIVSCFNNEKFELVFSQAAFEHFDDIEYTISQISRVCKPGAILVSEIDLKTHSRWLKDKDPNNIYRYSKYVYKVFSYRGIPNRVRPYKYKETLERFGWRDIRIIPLSKIVSHNNAYAGLHHEFADKKNEMAFLSIMVCATKI